MKILFNIVLFDIVEVKFYLKSREDSFLNREGIASILTLNNVNSSIKCLAVAALSSIIS